MNATYKIPLGKVKSGAISLKSLLYTYFFSLVTVHKKQF